MNGIFASFPEDHFGKPHRDIWDSITRGESIGVYGMPGIGIQYYMKFLEFRIREEFPKHHVIFIRSKLATKNLTDEIGSRIREINRNPSSSLEDILSDYQEDSRLVILLDGLSYIPDPGELLDYLDGLRKTNPMNIVVITSLDYTIFSTLSKVLVKHGAAITSLHRLELFNEEGAKRIIDINNKYYGWDVPLTLTKKIHTLSGGNPRLIKYISRSIFEDGPEIIEDLSKLSQHSVLAFRLSNFTELLFELDIRALQKLNIVTHDLELFSPLLKYSLRNYEISNLDTLAPQLTSKERRLFSLLFINRGRLVSKEQLDFVMGLMGENYSLWASYKALNRLKEKIDSSFNLESVRGRGYILQTKKE